MPACLSQITMLTRMVMTLQRFPTRENDVAEIIALVNMARQEAGGGGGGEDRWGGGNREGKKGHLSVGSHGEEKKHQVTLDNVETLWVWTRRPCLREKE